MPLPRSYPSGSPEWHLARLADKLMKRQARYDMLEDYHMGNQPLPHVDPQERASVRELLKKAQTNYVTLVNKAPVDRMSIKYFRTQPDGEPDPDARKIWAVNDMPVQATKVHTASAIFGDSYVLVGPVNPETGCATIVAEDPRVAIVEPDPQYPMKSLAGLRLYRDIYLDRAVAVLYLPDAIYTFLGPSMFAQDPGNEMTDRPLGVQAGNMAFDLVEVQENELGEVPLYRFPWQPDYSDTSLGEAELVLHIQDRINQVVLDRLKIAKDEAFNQKYVTGVEAISDQRQKSKPAVQSPYKGGSDKVWVATDPQAKFGQLTGVDFKQMLEAARDDIADIAAITQTPSHYMMNRFINVSGDTLNQAEAGFVAKTKQRMHAQGWGWEAVMRACFKYQGLSKASAPELTVVWHDPRQRKDVESADSFSKAVSGGMEIGLAMEQFFDSSPEQIAYARKYRDEQQRRAEEQAMQQQKLAAQNRGGTNKSPQGGNTNV